jgi:hypothetical protein
MLSDTNFPGQRFVFSAPAVETVSTDDNQLALFFENDNPAGTYPNSLKLRVGNTTKGSTNSSSRSPIPQIWSPTPGIILP